MSNFQLHVPHHVQISKQKKCLPKTARLTNSCAVAAVLLCPKNTLLDISEKGWV